MNYLILIISSLYALAGIISVLGYIPTIKDLLKNKKSANTSSYFVWTFTSLIAFAYAFFVVKNILLEIVTAMGFFCCVSIFILSLVKTNK
jgi:uncharacterized protein with PQ loop repeat